MVEQEQETGNKGPGSQFYVSPKYVGMRVAAAQTVGW